MAAIYQADIWCTDCADKIREDICKAGTAPTDPDDEHSYDSGEWPKNAGDNDESDCPQHCAAGAECLNYSETSDGEKYGYFFENTLTDDGDEYVKETVNENLRDGRMDSPAVELWKPCYNYIEYHEKCSQCGAYGDLDEDDKCDDCVDSPEPGDYTITPCGSLGGMSGVGVIEGKFIGEFDCDTEAIVAIRRIMDEEKFWPNIWIVSDHGNWTLHLEDDDNDN